VNIGAHPEGFGERQVGAFDERCGSGPATADALFRLACQRLVGERKSGKLIAEELLVDRAGEGDRMDRHASDLLRLWFLEVADELN
jgi:hypothetical protein